jgi:hypothetical protein
MEIIGLQKVICVQAAKQSGPMTPDGCWTGWPSSMQKRFCNFYLKINFK